MGHRVDAYPSQAQKATAMYKTLILSALTAAIAVAAPAVHAGELADRTATHVTVSMSDVDFQNPGAQAKQAYKRVVAAAHNACDSNSDDMMTQAADHACEHQAVKGALSDLNQPALYRAAGLDNTKAPQQYAFNDRR